MANLADDNSDNRAAIARAGGIEAVVAAMRALPRSEGVQRWGCGALENRAMRFSRQQKHYVSHCIESSMNFNLNLIDIVMNFVIFLI